jgi:hypothetical protein
LSYDERRRITKPLDKKISDIDYQIENKELEIARTKDQMLREGLNAFIQSLEVKKELKERAKKLIDL